MSKEIEKLPADKLIKMTSTFHRSFNSLGCDPACHCCYKKIPSGTMFKLATIRSVHCEARGGAIGSTTFAPEVLKVINDPSIKNERVIDITKEVMLCDKCTSEDFQKRQLDDALNDLKAYKKWKAQGGGCYRINGKIVH